MDQDIDTAGRADQAFQDLRSEVSLLRRAIEGLTAERQTAPDYGPTLADQADQLTLIANWARKVAETPLLRLTPGTIGDEIARVAEKARGSDRETIAAARTDMREAVGWVRAVVEQAAQAEEQFRQLCLAAGIGILAGMMLAFGLSDISREGLDHMAAPPPTCSQAGTSSRPPPRACRSRALLSVDWMAFWRS